MVKITCMAKSLVLLVFLLIPIMAKLEGDLPANTCICAVQDASLYPVAGFEHHIIQYLLHNQCVFTNGSKDSIFGVTWYDLKISDRKGALWVAGNYLSMGKATNDTCGLP